MFNVYKLINTELFVGGERKLLTTIAGNKRAINQFVRYGGYIPTHMGEIRKLSGLTGYIYYTNIGATYLFERDNGADHK